MSFGYIKVSVDNEQDAVNRIAKFLVDEIGWTVAEDIADTGSDRDITFQSDGDPSSDNDNTRYVRIKGQSNDIELFTYETYTDSTTNTGEVWDSSFGHLQAVGSFDLWVVADLERVILALQEDGGNIYFGYAGRIDSYYKPIEHPYPNLVKGMQNGLYDWFYSSNPRNMWMKRSDGSTGHYYAIKMVDDSTVNSSPSARDGSVSLFKMPLVYDVDSSYYEAVGEPRGVYWVTSEIFQHGDFLAIDDLVYLIIEEDDGDYSWACGPVASGILTPPPPVPSGIDITTYP